MNLTRRELLLATPALPALGACASQTSQHRDKPVTTLAKELGVCDVAYVLLKDGRPAPSVSVFGCDDANRSDSEKASSTDGIFQAASLTKPVIAFGALRLVLDGQLDLNSPVANYLPRGYRHFHNVLARSSTDASDLVSTKALAAIPVATLLNHTSGLPNWANGSLLTGSPAGEKWRYSGEGYMLLQAVIEAVAGMDIATYFDTQVFGLLGMRDSSLLWRDDLGPRVKTGRSASGKAQQVRWQVPVAAASLYTTATDYARFISALLADQALLSLTISNLVSVEPRLGLDWGYGWGVEHGDSGPLIWQWGNNPGFRSFAMASLSTKDGFVLLTNSELGMPLAASLARMQWPSVHSAFRFSMVS